MHAAPIALPIPRTVAPVPGRGAARRAINRACAVVVAARFRTVVADGPRMVTSARAGVAECDALWNRVLSRQGLHPETRLGSWHEVGQAGLGIHAARLPTPVATVAARCEDPTAVQEVVGRSDASTATTIRCMRRTLHLLPVELAVPAHRATLGYRERDAERLAVRAGAGAARLARADEQLKAVLADAPVAPRAIEAALAAEGTAVPVARAALKLAWERGTITCLNVSGRWNRELRVFALTERACPGLLAPMDRDEAIRVLIEAYFDRYGPATIADAMWWSGLARRDVVAAMDAAPCRWARLDTEWAASAAFMTEARYEEHHTVPGPMEPAVALLAHEDVALKAYFETRCRYLGRMPAGAVFNSIGEVLPTVLSDGRVVGRWQWHPRRGVVHWTALSDTLDAALCTRIDTAAEHLTHVLRPGWDPPPGAGEADPGQLALAI
ncbi:MAG: hypothetical protein QG671_2764 [Actinomycetota bacterium]|nr:hypothetical protein [Actinomycetota bacterium]